MILINKKLLLLFALIVTGFTLGGGLFGYNTIISSKTFTGAAIKFQAERFLFYSFLATTLLITGYAIILFYSRHVDRQLDKLIEMSRYSDIYPEKHFIGFGPLGERLKLLFKNINNLNIRKTLKISALANLNEFLMKNINLPVIVTDITGMVLYTSAGFLEKFKYNKGDLKSKKIDSVFPELIIPTLILELIRHHVPVEEESDHTIITCYPIHNVSAEVNYIVFVPNKKAVYTESHKSSEEAFHKGNALLEGLGKILSKRRS